jgi:hypothetical protein
MAKSIPQTDFSEKQVKKALARLDSLSLIRHLQTIRFDTSHLIRLLGIIRRDSDFLIKRAEPSRRKSRTEFISQLRSFLDQCSVCAAAQQLDDLICHLERIEEGYEIILAALQACAAAALPPEVQAAAALSRANANYEMLMRQSQASIAKHTTIIPQSFRAEAPDGTSFSPDGVSEAINTIATITLKLLAYQNQWFDTRGCLQLPALPLCTDEELKEAGTTEALAAAWRHWERMEQRSRYFEGTIEKFSRDTAPVELPHAAKSWFRYDQICDPEIWDYLAHYRLNNRLTQTYLEMILKTDVVEHVAGGKAQEFAPSQLISTHEAHACQSLSEMLGYDIGADQSLPGGLRLVAWVRGYSVLQLLARDVPRQDDAHRLHKEIARADLVAMLENAGLKNGQAALFIDRTTFHRSSRDFFDQPLLQGPEDQITIVAIGLRDSDPARLTLSALSNLGEKLEGKGKAFENAMLNFFISQGLDARAFKFNDGKDEYQYDILISWQGQVFLFECKNHSLSGQSASSTYYFHKEMLDAKKQVRRQADALVRFAEKVESLSGIKVTSENLVPCILNSLPYAVPGAADNIITTDASTIKRFFQERFVHSIQPHFLKNGAKVLHRTALISLWSGDRPTALDFMRYLDDPVTIKMSLPHVEAKPYPFALDQHHPVQVRDLAYTAMTPHSVAQIFSLEPEKIAREQRSVARAIQAAQHNKDKKDLIKIKRAWREKRKRPS